MEVDKKKLAEFLVRAKTTTYAGGGEEVPPEKVERPDHKELEHREGNWVYRDSYVGFYAAPGSEYVRINGIKIWSMSYSGGMTPEYVGNEEFAKKTYDFLKKALSKMEVSRPFRGPNHFKEGDFEYFDKSEGDLTRFRGEEKITFKGKEVFSQDYIGCLVIYK